MQYHYTNPNWVNSIEELFKPEVKWVGVMDGRDCETGFLAFGYPESKYGYTAYTQVTVDEITALKSLLEARGYIVHRQESENVFLYKVPGSKWWTDFPENLVSVML